MTEHLHDPEDAVSSGIAAMPPARSRIQNRTIWGLFGALVIVALIAVFGLLSANNARRDAQNTASDNHGLHSQVSALANQVKGLGATPVTGPSGQAGPTGAAGQNATDAQVQAAVAEYLTLHPVASPRIDYTQLRAYVVTYLADHPAPSGASGTNGSNGTNGTNGKDGQNATDAQVASAVSAYLMANPPSPGPTGATGPAGQNGSNGADGQPPVSWTYLLLGITYECDRTAPFDPAKPTYTCAPQVAGSS